MVGEKSPPDKPGARNATTANHYDRLRPLPLAARRWLYLAFILGYLFAAAQLLWRLRASG